MSSLTQIYRFSNNIYCGYKALLQGRVSLLCSSQTCNYSRKSAEERLGIEKPKRPLTPFFKFMTQMRPALVAKNPGISAKEAIAWSSKHWQQLDVQTKTKMVKEYEKDLEDYKKIKVMYESSLTEDQKADIKRVKEELAHAREKRKQKAEYKELGRPKKPMSSYFLYIKSRNDNFIGMKLKDYQEKVKQDWMKLTATEKAKFEKMAQDLMVKYKKDLEAWELKMITMGRTDLVRTKPTREKKAKSAKSE